MYGWSRGPWLECRSVGGEDDANVVAFEEAASVEDADGAECGVEWFVEFIGELAQRGGAIIVALLCRS